MTLADAIVRTKILKEALLSVGAWAAAPRASAASNVCEGSDSRLFQARYENASIGSASKSLGSGVTTRTMPTEDAMIVVRNSAAESWSFSVAKTAAMLA